MTRRAVAQAKGAAGSRRAAERFALRVLPRIRELQAQGITTLPTLADALNAEGRTARLGGPWRVASVRAVLRRGKGRP
jgi:hypothetical protein